MEAAAAQEERIILTVRTGRFHHEEGQTLQPAAKGRLVSCPFGLVLAGSAMFGAGIFDLFIYLFLHM